MSDRKKPGAAFWATVALVAMLLYVASFGPALRFVAGKRLRRQVIEQVYWPLLYAFPPQHIRRFGEIWMPRDAHVLLYVSSVADDEYWIPFDGP